jgi:uncharacterized protein YndB with AHSA1/START domain
MKIDVTRAIGAVTREVASRDHEGQPARVVIVSRTYDTGIEDVWDAITSAERIPRWFAPVTGDLRLGGRYQIQGNAGGTITGCDPPRSFALTWEFAGATSWVTVRLDEQGDRTRMVLEHIARPDEHWERFGPGATGVGWELGLLGLAEHLGGAARVKPENAMEWMASEEARTFMTLSNDGWRRAAIIAGMPEAEAGAAAERNLKAHFGEA